MAHPPLSSLDFLVGPASALTDPGVRLRARILAALGIPLVLFGLASVARSTPEALPIHLAVTALAAAAYGLSRTRFVDAAAGCAVLACSVLPYAGLYTEAATTDAIQELMWMTISIVVAALALRTAHLVGWCLANAVVLGVLLLSNPGIPPAAAWMALAFVGLISVLTWVSSAVRSRHEAEIAAHTEALELALRTLSIEQDLVRQTLDGMTDSLVVTDGDGRIVLVNRELCALLGYRARKLRGLPAPMLFGDPEEGEAVFAELRALEGRISGRLQRSMSFRAADGTQIPVALHAARRHDHTGAVVGMVCIARDTRQEIRLLAAERLGAAEQARSVALATLNLELRETVAEVAEEGSRRSLSRLAGGVGHAINNPLTSLILSAGFLVQDLSESDTRNQKNIATILASAERCRVVVRALMDFGQQGEGGYFPLSVAEVVQSCLLLARAELEARGARITVAVDPELEVLGDRKRLERLVLNLVRNAGDALEGRGDIRIGAVSEGGEVVLTVEDTGRGMAREVQDRLFEPFFSTDALVGSGLGLASSWGIVWDHGGDIDVHSAPGAGTRMTVSLPRYGP